MKITANMVTIARILLLPVPYIMFLTEQPIWEWAAFFMFAALGTTDFIDGYMARRDGPTRFGSLLDPVADKIFVASIMFALAATHIIPVWAISAIFLREFLLTALRTSVALRKAEIKTSDLAKVKTVFQMGGFGSIFLAALLPGWVVSVTLAGLCLFLGALWVIFFRRRAPLWLPCSIGAWAMIAICALFFSRHDVIMLQVLIIVGLTWWSGLDYVVGSYRIFKKQPLNLHEWSRLLWSVVFSLGVIPVVGWMPKAFVLLVALSFELGLGGIDNISAAAGERLSRKFFLLTSVVAVLGTIAIYAAVLGYWQIKTHDLTMLILAGSISACLGAFFEKRHLFKGAL